MQKVLSLSEKQKALSQYADTAEAQKFVSQAPIPQQQQQQPQLSQQQINYIEAAPTKQAAQARKAKILRDPVVWQITQKQMKELQWKRKQLLQAQKAELEKKRKARALRGPPPKLGMSKARIRQAEEQKKQEEEKRKQTAAAAAETKKKQDAAKSVEGQSKNAPPKPKTPAAKPPQQKPAAQKAPAKAPPKAPAKPPAKAPSKPPTKK